MYYPSWKSFGTHSKTNCQIKVLMQPVSRAWDWGCRSWKTKTSKPGRQEQSTQKTGTISTTCCTTRVFPIFRKSSKQSLSAGITTIHQQIILELRKHENLFPGNTTGQHFAIMSKTMWRDAIYAWPQKQSSTSSIMTYNLCQFISTAGKIYWWILSLVYQFW